MGGCRRASRISAFSAPFLQIRTATSAALALAALFALAGGQPPAAAQLPPLAPVANSSPTVVAADPLDAAEIQTRLAAVAGDIDAAAAALANAEDGSAVSQAVQAQLDRLRRVRTLLEQQREIVADLAEASATTPTTDVEPTPVEASILRLDELRERQRREAEARDALGAALEASREALASAKDKLESANQKRRAAKQELEAAETEAAREAATRQLRLQQIRSREAAESVHLRTLETRRAEAAIDAAERLEAQLAQRIAAVQEALAAGGGSEADTAAHVAGLIERLRRERENLERDLSTAELRLEAAQRRFARQDDPSPEVAEELELALTRRDSLRKQMALLDERIARVDQRGPLLRRWQEVLRGKASRQQLRDWQEEAEQLIAEIEQTQLQQRGGATATRQRLNRLEARADDYAEGSRVRAHVDEQRRILGRQLDALEEHDRELAATRRLAENLEAAIDERTGGFDVVESLERGARILRELWHYELTAVNDEPITVASVITALVLMAVGVFLSRRISRAVGRLSVRRFKVEHGAAAALQTLAFYVLLASFTLFALRMVNFPLTAFTVLGGALAIGIGFGSQNVMNNFISGLILMLERPVRAQDVVEIDGMPGTIEKIGARSTQIRSVDGRAIIVPNSFFLESNVVNWTLSDDLIRAKVTVGVVYGSPTRLVEKLIRQAVDENDGILKTPTPIIIFEDFGDNSLHFDVFFWVRARSPMQMRIVQSRLRFRIDDLFRENDIVIAFPQRDVHLDSVSPIDVRLLRGNRHDPGDSSEE